MLKIKKLLYKKLIILLKTCIFHVTRYVNITYVTRLYKNIHMQKA